MLPYIEIFIALLVLSAILPKGSIKVILAAILTAALWSTLGFVLVIGFLVLCQRKR